MVTGKSNSGSHKKKPSRRCGFPPATHLILHGYREDKLVQPPGDEFRQFVQKCEQRVKVLGVLCVWRSRMCVCGGFSISMCSVFHACGCLEGRGEGLRVWERRTVRTTFAKRASSTEMASACKWLMNLASRWNIQLKWILRLVAGRKSVGQLYNPCDARTLALLLL
eukprot:365907-Chlamydomonas_euryale.AAC.26